MKLLIIELIMEKSSCSWHAIELGVVKMDMDDLTRQCEMNIVIDDKLTFAQAVEMLKHLDDDETLLTCFGCPRRGLINECDRQGIQWSSPECWELCFPTARHFGVPECRAEMLEKVMERLNLEPSGKTGLDRARDVATVFEKIRKETHLIVQHT